MSTEASKTCVRRHFDELWNEGRLDTAAQFFADDFMNFGEQYQDGACILRRIVTIWRTAFPDLHYIVDAMTAEGDVVVAEVTFTGTHRGEFHLVPPYRGPSGPVLMPNGRSFRVQHMHRFRLRDGKIVEHAAVRDDLGMFSQLGHLGALSVPSDGGHEGGA